MNDKQRSEDQKRNEWLEENCRIQVEYPDMAEKWDAYYNGYDLSMHSDLGSDDFTLYRCPGSKYWNKRCKADTDGGCAICISGNVSGLFVSVLLGR